MIVIVFGIRLEVEDVEDDDVDVILDRGVSILMKTNKE